MQPSPIWWLSIIPIGLWPLKCLPHFRLFQPCASWVADWAVVVLVAVAVALAAAVDKAIKTKESVAASAVAVAVALAVAVGGGGGGGVFNIPPGRTGRLEVKTVCLEEGKPDPKSRIEYVIQPLDALNSDPKIYEMIRMLANNEISQPAAQAAAWHVTDGLSWQELLVKNRVERMDGSFIRYFHPDHLRFAQQIVVAAAERADARAKAQRQYQTKTESYGDYDSDNE